MKHIKSRKNIEYKMQLAIAQNPHAKNPQELWDLLNKQDTKDNIESATLDVGGMELLKARMSENPRIIVK